MGLTFMAFRILLFLVSFVQPGGLYLIEALEDLGKVQRCPYDYLYPRNLESKLIFLRFRRQPETVSEVRHIQFQFH